jgi:pimeloyl-ACP methyl ester carboxylesterase
MKAGLAVIGVACLLTAGCCHLPVRGPDAPPPPLPAELSAQFDYPRALGLDASETGMRSRAWYEIRRIDMAAVPDRFDARRTVVLDYYSPRGGSKKPVVLLLPISGGGYGLEEFFATYFARRGWAAVIVHRRKMPHEPADGEELNGMLKGSIVDARRAMDWIETRPELDATKMAVLGVSMGGIRATLLAAVDPRVQVAVLGLAGGDLPYVLRHTTERGIARRREAVLKKNGLTPDGLEELYRKGLECDPNRLAPYLPRDRVLMVLGCWDHVVPIEKGRELRKNLRRPETILIPSGHYSALLCLPYIRHQAFEFMRERLEPQNHKATE